MSFLRNLLRRFDKQCETTENHFDADLRTKYYKTNFQNLFQSVHDVCESDPNLQIVNVSKEHGEIAIEIPRKHIFFIITVTAVRPFETALDINASTENFSLFGSYYQVKAEVIHFYEKFNKLHTFIGAGKGAIK